MQAKPDHSNGLSCRLVERSPDSPPAEPIICGSWNDVHVGL